MVSVGRVLVGVTLTREEEMKSSAELTPAMQSELDAINELLRKTADELESSGRMKTLRHLMAEYDTPFVNEDDMFSIFDKIPAYIS